MKQYLIAIVLLAGRSPAAHAETFRLDTSTLIETQAVEPAGPSSGGVVGGFAIGRPQPESSLRIVSVQLKTQPVRLGEPLDFELLLENATSGQVIYFPTTRDLSLEQRLGKTALISLTAMLQFTGGPLDGEALDAHHLYGSLKDAKTTIRLRPADRLSLRYVLPVRFARPGAWKPLGEKLAAAEPVTLNSHIKLLLRVGPSFLPAAKSSQFQFKLQGPAK